MNGEKYRKKCEKWQKTYRKLCKKWQKHIENYAKSGKKIDLEKTLLFFDEVQVSENFIVSLKYFNESEKPYKIVCAGSLLRSKNK